jgi:hypothetical protein
MTSDSSGMGRAMFSRSTWRRYCRAGEKGCGEEVSIELCCAEDEAHGGLRWLWFLFIILFSVMVVMAVVIVLASSCSHDRYGGL